MDDLATAVYDKGYSLIGKKLKNGTIIKKMLVNGLKDHDTLIFLGEKNEKEVIVKFVYDNNLDGILIGAAENMNSVKEVGIPMYFYELDKLDDPIYEDNETNAFLVLEKLLNSSDVIRSNRNYVFLLLIQLIQNIFKYKSFMTHSDIKPDNIMFSEEKKIFYLIDYDSICKKKLLYGYERCAFTPNFASQTNKFVPMLMTIKNDIIELIFSAHALYYQNDPREIPDKENEPWYVTWETDHFSNRRIFGILLLIAYNINEKNITNEDMFLLLKTIENIELYISNKDISKEHILNKTYELINSGLDNSEIISQIFKK